METDLSGSSFSNLDQDQELLKSTKTKVGEVREENERLKKLLVKVVNDYESLESKVSTILRSQSSLSKSHEDDKELVSLSLGRRNSNNKKDTTIDTNLSKRRKVDGGLELGLQCKLFETYPVATPVITSDLIMKDEENNTILKEEESLHPLPQVKKTRVCIRSRCDTPTMNDGCQWRKYGQKTAKGNPCPRAYYRCTISPSCPVRKQVQRCADDMSILITTYEGSHNHPLPLSATTMASATTAAAAMLKTGSSQSSILGPTLSTTSFGLHNNSSFISPFNPNSRVSITNPTMISSSHNSHPTVTLDLTTPNNNNLSSPFNWLSPLTINNNSSNFLNFSSSSFSSSSSVSTSLDFTSKTANAPNSWGGGHLNYATLYPYNNTKYQMPIINSQATLNETIAAVATDPNFQSVLAAAISTYVGNKAAADNERKTSSSSPSSNSRSDSSRNLSLFPTLESKNDSSTSADKRDNIS